MGDNTKKQQHNTSSSLDISKTVTEANTFVDMLEGDGDAIPTQSYFDYPSSKSKNDEENNSDDGDKRDSSSVSGGRANANESRSQGRIGVGNGGTNSELSSRRSSDKGVQVKTPSNLIPISRYDASTITRGQRTRRPPSSSSAGVGSSEETKTNDDNAIIDESKLQRTGRRNGEEEQQEVVASVQRSIDGFPPAYPDSDRVANQAPSESVSSIFAFFLFCFLSRSTTTSSNPHSHDFLSLSLSLSSFHFSFQVSCRTSQLDIH